MIRVVVADDHPFLRAGLESVLRTANIMVAASVGDGEAALAAVAEHDPQVLVLDVGMPKLDGLAVLKRLRDGGDKRPVILLTAHLDDGQLLAAIRAGVNGIVLKDGVEDRLIDSIRTVAIGHRALDPAMMERALEVATQAKPTRRIDRLNRRETEIADRVTRGMRNREIAQELGMSEGSIKVYLHRIFGKLDVGSRTELALLYRSETG